MLWRMSADTSHRRIGILFIVSMLAPRSPRAFRGARAVPCCRPEGMQALPAKPARCGRLRRSTRLARTSQTSETSQTSQTPAAVLLGGNKVLGCLHCQQSLDLGRYLFAEDLHLVDQLLHRIGREIEAEQVGDAGLAEGVGLVDDLGRRAYEVDVLVGGRALALEGRFAERHQVLVHLALAEALDGGLVRPADMD